MNTPKNEDLVMQDNWLSSVLSQNGCDRGRLIYDEYRTTFADGKDQFVMVLITRLLLERDRRIATQSSGSPA